MLSSYSLVRMYDTGIYSVLPWLVMAASANVGGALADRLVRSGLSVTRVRKIMQSVGFIGPALFMSQLAHVVNPGQAVLCMVLCQVRTKTTISTALKLI